MNLFEMWCKGFWPSMLWILLAVIVSILFFIFAALIEKHPYLFEILIYIVMFLVIFVVIPIAYSFNS